MAAVQRICGVYFRRSCALRMALLLPRSLIIDWKILSDAGSTSASSTEANRSPAGVHSSSDDSNCSNQTTHSMVTSVASPTANKALDTVPTMAAALAGATEPPMKFVTTPQMAETTLQRLRQRLGGPMASGNGLNNESAMRSMELLRISVQQAFDKEVNEIVKRFMESYFKPAFGNIKENLGQNAVTEETLLKMSCALLENAKFQYNTIRPRNQLPAAAVVMPVAEDQTQRLPIKRPATKQVFELNHKVYAATPIIQTEKIQTTITNTMPPKPQPIVVPQKPQPIAVPNPTAPMRRQIFWNTAHISTTTKFVLDVQANLAFGFGTDGKERLASKHPELIRYLPDAEDRDWLTAQSIIPQQNRNSRFLFLIHDEVCRLQQTHDLYRNKPNVDLALMLTFTVPEFMIQKMKLFFVDLNIKSRGLITNSFSIGNSAQSNSHLRNALLQGVQSNQSELSSGNGNSTGGSAVAAPSGAGVVSSAGQTNFVEQSSSVTLQANNLGGIKPAKVTASSLSSSHATLTALLNNSSSSSNNAVNTDKANFKNTSTNR